MQVVDRVEREVEHDHMVHVRHVEPSRGDVRADLPRQQRQKYKNNSETKHESFGSSVTRDKTPPEPPKRSRKNPTTTRASEARARSVLARSRGGLCSHQVLDLACLEAVEVGRTFVAGHVSVVGKGENVRPPKTELHRAAALDRVAEYRRPLELPAS